MLDYISIKELKVRAKTHYRQANTFSRGTLGILVRTYQTFSEENAFEAAASIAYYALFSLFPLLLFLVTIASSFLESKAVVQKVLEFTATALPTAQYECHQDAKYQQLCQIDLVISS